MKINREEFKIEPDADDEMSYAALTKHLEEDLERKKKKNASEFEEMGDKFLQEIDRKNKKKDLKRQTLIPYILKYRSDIHDEDELNSYSFEDVQNIYDEIKEEKKSPIIKFFQFIFNID